MQNSRTVSKLGRVCCKTSKWCRIPKSLSMSIDIVWSLFIRYWSILYIYHLPSPAGTLTDTCLLALIGFGFIIVQEIYLNCKSTKPHINYHFLQGGTAAENSIRNPLFGMLLAEWNFIKAYFPDTRTLFPAM